jgi:hypothetical protein
MIANEVTDFPEPALTNDANDFLRLEIKGHAAEWR